MIDVGLRASLLRTGSFALLTAATLQPAPLLGQTWADATHRRAHTGEEVLDVRVRYGAGSLNLHAGDAAELYRVHLRYDQSVFEPVHVFDDGTLTVGVRGVDGATNLRTRSGGSLDVVLSPNVETRLDMEFGAVEADVDLGGLALTELAIKTGASETRIDVSRPNSRRIEEATFEAGAAEFSATNLGNLNAERIRVNTGVGDVQVDFGGEWQRGGAVELNVGLGSVELTFPRDLGVRLMRSGFLASVDVDGLRRQDDGYISPNWDSAEHRVTVDVTAAFGSVRVEWGR